jgi:hypothetical protein
VSLHIHPFLSAYLHGIVLGLCILHDLKTDVVIYFSFLVSKDESFTGFLELLVESGLYIGTPQCDYL